MDLRDFGSAVHQVQSAILDEFEATPLTKKPPAPRDFQEMKATLRHVAEELILCGDVSEAIARLRRDQTGELASVLFLTVTMLPPDSHVTAIKRAHASTLHEPTVLPFHAFCAYLIELADGLEVVNRPPES
jgi:hypothetical protein